MNTHTKKRLNSGGVQLNSGGLILNLGFSVEKVSDIFLGLLGFQKEPSNEDLLQFDKSLFEFIKSAPYYPASLPSNNSNLTILMRYNSQKEEKNNYRLTTAKRIKWTDNDNRLFDKYIYNGKENQLYEIYKCYSTNSITSRIRVRKDIIYSRPLEYYEISLVDNYILKGLSLDTLVGFFRLRTKKSLQQPIEERRRYLQMKGLIKK
ncbi:hypothetical protein M9Y10_037377 [Tritrichomonas musculus]|uniref:Uncharacterized protein n=1 Tax=Tritrichomonas musculus TaxID=1915356 RepID=A0ABR2GT93_9EUKA